MSQILGVGLGDRSYFLLGNGPSLTGTRLPGTFTFLSFFTVQNVVGYKEHIKNIHTLNNNIKISTCANNIQVKKTLTVV